MITNADVLNFANELWSIMKQKYSKVPDELNIEFMEIIQTEHNNKRGYKSHPRVAGIYYIGTNKIVFSTRIMGIAGTLERFKDTIIHELSHVVVSFEFPDRKIEHGPEFKKICQEFGGSGSTTHDIDLSSIRRKISRYMIKCKVCNEEYGLTKPMIKKIADKNYRPQCYCGSQSWLRVGWKHF